MSIKDNNKLSFKEKCLRGLEYMDKIDEKEVKSFYEKLDNVWPKDDKWHDINQKEIKRYIHQFSFDSCKILNAGSGGNNYDIKNDMCHIDIAENKKYEKSHSG